jgi:hypothetical protein
VCYADALVAELMKVTAPDRLAKGGDISYQEKPTAALVLITADGQVEERTATGDAQRKLQLEREIADEKKRIDTFLASEHGRSAAPPPGPAPRIGGQPGPMEEMGPGRR